eukprot:TRINITY_DN55577_c0_g2_i1.p1 TRINITY_DN55577_c0_g2~~TRINITY_DN55577_c0_g2_i1.p1  ORF type:complete len:237 (+),score=26.77 TRINITY_DN55577_c0_g2_i1:55-711(+)
MHTRLPHSASFATGPAGGSMSPLKRLGSSLYTGDYSLTQSTTPPLSHSSSTVSIHSPSPVRSTSTTSNLTASGSMIGIHSHSRMKGAVRAQAPKDHHTAGLSMTPQPTIQAPSSALPSFQQFSIPGTFGGPSAPTVVVVANTPSLTPQQHFYSGQQGGYHNPSSTATPPPPLPRSRTSSISPSSSTPTPQRPYLSSFPTPPPTDHVPPEGVSVALSPR